MKTIIPNSKVSEFFHEINPKVGKKYSKILSNYNIFTVEQLAGAISPDLPIFSEKEAVCKGLVNNYNSVQQNNQKDSVKIKKIKKLFSTNQKEASLIYESLNKVEFPIRVMKSTPSFLSMGLQVSTTSEKSSYWASDYQVNEFEGTRYIIPDYERMGSVFDQGSRGTCVANAATSLVDYITDSRTSRQFLYHQCKMIDGHPNRSGTNMYNPIKITCNKQLKDYGTVNEEEWQYNDDTEDTEHQGPPPENCFYTKRYYSNQPVYIRELSIINDIKTILLGSNIVSAAPVTIGFALYESFNSYSTRRTGWVTIPLPEEEITGYHAMLIVGWDDVDKVFIVRNSWSTSWAAENKDGMPGHALIPYKYIKEYTHNGCSLLSMENSVFEVKERDRLYRNMKRSSQPDLRKVAASESKASKPERKRSVFIKIIKILIVLGILGIGFRFLFPGTFFLLRYYVVEIYLRIYTFIIEFDLF